MDHLGWTAANLHLAVKSSGMRAGATSKFEVTKADTVNTKATHRLAMQSKNTIENIDEEQQLDRITAEQLARIIEFLRNLED
ncbi:MAG: hypothetical protein NWE93_09815 [Candidatus Bathyarchaeota archaeon]|nr:hypothetical protein [Candidatus Bathyarchaeota archaeon]